MSEHIQIDVQDGRADAQVFTPEGSGPWTPVVFFPDAGGVRPAMEQMAARFAKAGHVVLLPNVYHRQAPFAPFDFKTVFQVEPERERLMTLMRSLDGKQLMADVAQFIGTLLARPEVKGSQVGAVGYCMGGRHALLAAIAHPKHIAAAASIHGGGLATDAPDSPHRNLAALQAQLYFAVADHDRSCTPEQQAELCKALASASKSFQLELYAGAGHGFAVPDAPVYARAAAERHYSRVTTLFAESLGQ